MIPEVWKINRSNVDFETILVSLSGEISAESLSHPALQRYLISSKKFLGTIGTQFFFKINDFPLSWRRAIFSSQILLARKLKKKKQALLLFLHEDVCNENNFRTISLNFRKFIHFQIPFPRNLGKRIIPSWKSFARTKINHVPPPSFRRIGCCWSVPSADVAISRETSSSLEWSLARCYATRSAEREDGVWSG